MLESPLLLPLRVLYGDVVQLLQEVVVLRRRRHGRLLGAYESALEVLPLRHQGNQLRTDGRGLLVGLAGLGREPLVFGPETADQIRLQQEGG